MAKIIHSSDDFFKEGRPYAYLFGVMGIIGMEEAVKKELSDVELTILHTVEPLEPDEDDSQEWDFKAIRYADAFVAWFTSERLPPHRMASFGCASESKLPLFVGISKNCAGGDRIRRWLAMHRPDVEVRDSFEELLGDLKQWTENWKEPAFELPV